MKSAKVYLREEDKSVAVNITGIDKPPLGEEIINKWQRIIDTTAKIFDIPAGLIMKISEDHMEVFLKSNTENNPYSPNGSDSLGHGLYCETAIGRNAMLEVPDSSNDKHWENNPDVALNMISYLGFPIKWPDGETFGTICVLDSKKREHSSEYQDLLFEFKSLLESDLERELRNRDLHQSESISSLRLREIHHRIKNQFNILSSIIQLKSMTSQEDTQEILDEINSKIKGISLLHDHIYNSKDFSTSVTEYIKDVIKASISVYNTELSVEVIPKIKLEIDPERLFEFGIVFSELATNSIKHGLQENNARIQVVIDEIIDDDTEKYKLVYSDNGNGFAEDILEGTGDLGIGSMIIQSFLETFDGKVRQYNDNGAVTEFIFPKPQSL